MASGIGYVAPFVLENLTSHQIAKLVVSRVPKRRLLENGTRIVFLKSYIDEIGNPYPGYAKLDRGLEYLIDNYDKNHYQKDFCDRRRDKSK